MKTLLASALLLSFSTPLRAEVKDPIPLWPNGAPGALGNEDKDIPTVTPYLPEPDNATGGALVVCPGGGYGGLAQHEGKDYAILLTIPGITDIVLRFRMHSHGL